MSILKNDKIMRWCLWFSFCHSHLVKWHTGRYVTMLESEGFRRDTGRLCFVFTEYCCIQAFSQPCQHHLSWHSQLKCINAGNNSTPSPAWTFAHSSWASGEGVLCECLGISAQDSILHSSFAHNVTANSTLPAADCLLLTAKPGIFMCLNMVSKYLCLKCNELDFN